MEKMRISENEMRLFEANIDTSPNMTTIQLIFASTIRTNNKSDCNVQWTVRYINHMIGYNIFSVKIRIAPPLAQ